LAGVCQFAKQRIFPPRMRTNKECIIMYYKYVVTAPYIMACKPIEIFVNMIGNFLNDYPLGDLEM
jgi:hypothetical protein